MDQAGRLVANGAYKGEPVEDFGPIWDCAALRIARAAWVGAGLDIFLRRDVPYGATSSGRLSSDAVSLLRKAAPHRAGGAWRFLEIGAGSGLFAKLFLDALRDEAPDIYAQCQFILTDGNQSMLESVAAHGVLAGHEGRVALRCLDASSPWPADFAAGFDGIFGSYILDSLRADILVVGPDGLRQTVARCVLDTADGGEDLRAALQRPGFAHLVPFLPLRKHLAIQTRTIPVAAESLPFAAAIGPLPQDDDLPMVHCHGALACIAAIQAHLRPGGLAMLSDYGTLAPRDSSDRIEFQSFGASAAHAVNFHQLDGFCADHPSIAWLKPEAEDGLLITRVLYHGAADDLAETVDMLFGDIRQAALRLPIEGARDMLRANAFEAARRLYLKALALQPRNWSLAEEIATHLLLPAGDLADALALADLGLTLNPYAPGLHRVRAEALLRLERMDEAEAALATALGYHPESAEAHLLAARLHLHKGAYPAALLALARALANDAEGDLRDTLLALQQEALRGLTDQARDTLIAEVNQHRALDGLPR